MSITMYDIVFWLMVALIGLLAFSIEGGLANRNRRVVLIAIFSSLATGVFMMFHVEDKSEFKFEKIVKQVGPPGKRKVVQRNSNIEGEDEIEVVEINEQVEQLGRDGTTNLISEDGGIKDCPTCPVMIAVRSGFASVGSTPSEPGHSPEEAPKKRVGVPAFMVGKYEITVGQYAAFVEDSGHASTKGCMINGNKVANASWRSPGYRQTTAFPVVCVSLADIAAYVEWLKLKTGQRYRLPSESEWEYMARAGGASAYWTGPGITQEQARYGQAPVTAQAVRTDDAAKAGDAAASGPATVGFGGPNSFNLFDVHGNVWEIAADCWADDHKTLPAEGRAILRIPCAAQVAKGGGWTSDDDRLRVAARQPFEAGLAANTVGFRIARTP